MYQTRMKLHENNILPTICIARSSLQQLWRSVPLLAKLPSTEILFYYRRTYSRKWVQEKCQLSSQAGSFTVINCFFTTVLRKWLGMQLYPPFYTTKVLYKNTLLVRLVTLDIHIIASIESSEWANRASQNVPWNSAANNIIYSRIIDDLNKSNCIYHHTHKRAHTLLISILD